MNETFESVEKISIPIEVSYSVDDEVFRIRKTIEKYEWYKENGYNPDLPQEIKNRLEKSEEISDDEVRAITEKEYQSDSYQKKADELKQAWEAESADFLEKLKTLGRPMVEKYYISMTKYGTGGSYGYPDSIQLNVSKHDNRGVLYVTFHEMVHLAIQDLIREYDIPHWTKERLVDLTMNKFFPDKKGLQRDPEHAREIKEIFEREFPDIEKIIVEVSKL